LANSFLIRTRLDKNNKKRSKPPEINNYAGSAARLLYFGTGFAVRISRKAARIYRDKVLGENNNTIYFYVSSTCYTHSVRRFVMFKRSEKGFTLVELMIVVVIIGILASIAIPKFSSLISKTKVTEAKNILRQIVNLEKTYYLTNSAYFAFANGADCDQISFTQPDATSRRFEYKFDIVGAAPFDGSIATATENVDVNGDGDIDDGLTLTVADVQGVVNDLTW
jgi:prepilin-type N-terminal cleavage/methylation domain-containing protein